jgi:hypothetical protein
MYLLVRIQDALFARRVVLSQFVGLLLVERIFALQAVDHVVVHGVELQV